MISGIGALRIIGSAIISARNTTHGILPLFNFNISFVQSGPDLLLLLSHLRFILNILFANLQSLRYSHSLCSTDCLQVALIYIRYYSLRTQFEILVYIYFHKSGGWVSGHLLLGACFWAFRLFFFVFFPISTWV